MQCDVEVRDNIDPAMFRTFLQKKKKKKEHNFDTAYSSGYHSISKGIVKYLENISLFHA